MSLHFQSSVPVVFSLLLHEQTQVCCFLREVCVEMKELTQCEINCEHVLGCMETVPPQHHLKITGKRRKNVQLLACAHKQIFYGACRRKPQTMESEQII